MFYLYILEVNIQSSLPARDTFTCLDHQARGPFYEKRKLVVCPVVSSFKQGRVQLSDYHAHLTFFSAQLAVMLL